jgi:chemotaxis protein CheX
MPTVLEPLIPRTLVETLKNTFAIQASTEITIKSLAAVPPSPLAGCDLVSIIGMKSSTLSGLAALVFPAATFLGVVNRMLGENYTEINQENSDAAGEILNIIYGSARVKINDGGHDFTPAIPTVVKGTDVGVAHGDVPLVVRIACDSDLGPFFMEISLRRAQKVV